MDRAYVDFARLDKFHQSLSFFVLRAKSNMKYRRICSRPVDRSTGLICDQTIKLTGRKSNEKFPEQLRRAKYWDKEKKKTLTFITNNFSLPAMTICELYRSRWHVELFFKWIKQHLRIKKFYGTSENSAYYRKNEHQLSLIVNICSGFSSFCKQTLTRSEFLCQTTSSFEGFALQGFFVFAPPQVPGPAGRSERTDG